MNFCPYCGAPLVLQIPEGDDRPRYRCSACGRVHYENPKVVVGCIPLWEDKILLCRRNIEPQKGLWTLPAGYLENGETVKEGAIRETLEESGAVVNSLHTYLLLDIVHICQIYLMFLGQLESPSFHPTHESSEVALFTEKDVPWDAVAFRAIEKTLRCYFQDRAEGRFPFRNRQIPRSSHDASYAKYDTDPPGRR